MATIQAHIASIQTTLQRLSQRVDEMEAGALLQSSARAEPVAPPPDLVQQRQMQEALSKVENALKEDTKLERRMFEVAITHKCEQMVGKAVRERCDDMEQALRGIAAIQTTLQKLGKRVDEMEAGALQSGARAEPVAPPADLVQQREMQEALSRVSESIRVLEGKHQPRTCDADQAQAAPPEDGPDTPAVAADIKLQRRKTSPPAGRRGAKKAPPLAID